MMRTAAVLFAGAVVLTACGMANPQQPYGATDDGATAIGGQAWPYGSRDPAYRTMPGDDVYPWPLGQDKLDP